MGTFNNRTYGFNGKSGIGHYEVILKVCQELLCDVIGLKETRRDGHSTFTVAGYTVFALAQMAVSTKGREPIELD